MDGRGSSNPQGGGSGSGGGVRAQQKALLKEVDNLEFNREKDGTLSATLSNGMRTEIEYQSPSIGNSAVYIVQMIQPNGNFGSSDRFQTEASAKKWAKKTFTDAIKKRFRL